MFESIMGANTSIEEPVEPEAIAHIPHTPTPAPVEPLPPIVSPPANAPKAKRTRGRPAFDTQKLESAPLTLLASEKARLEKLANQYGVVKNQLTRFLLMRAIEQLEQGKLVLTLKKRSDIDF